MAAVDSEEIEAPKKASKLPLLLGLVGALALGGGGFYATYSGLILGDEAATEGGDTAGADDADSLDAGASGPSASEVSYIEVEPMIVSLGSAGRGRHLRFRAQLDVVPGGESTVTTFMPRILDVLNGYLRAVPVAELESPSALVVLRAQMLRRVQLVVGDGEVRDLLITEFVLN